MAIPTGGNVSLTQIRGNVGLGGAGSMSERAVQNQINYTSGAPMTAFRGAINGTQRQINGTRGSIVQYLTNQDLYLNAYNYSSVPSTGGTITTTATWTLWLLEGGACSGGGHVFPGKGLLPPPASREANRHRLGWVLSVVSSTRQADGSGQTEVLEQAGGYSGSFT